MISSSLRFNGVSASGARFAAVWLWAALGLVVTVFSFTVLGRWVASPDQFLAVPIPAEAMPAPGVLRLRLLEALSLAIAAGALGWFLVRPWLRTGRDGRGRTPPRCRRSPNGRSTPSSSRRS